MLHGGSGKGEGEHGFNSLMLFNTEWKNEILHLCRCKIRAGLVHCLVSGCEGKLIQFYEKLQHFRCFRYYQNWIHSHTHTLLCRNQATSSHHTHNTHTTHTWCTHTHFYAEIMRQVLTTHTHNTHTYDVHTHNTHTHDVHTHTLKGNRKEGHPKCKRKKQ